MNLGKKQLRDYITKELESRTWFGINNARKILIQETGQGKTIDPFKNPGGRVWNLVFNYLYFNRSYFEALTLCQSFLEKYYELQEKHSRRIHKGTPLQYLGLVFFSINQPEQSKKYHTLAFIEDVILKMEEEKTKGTTPTTGIITTPATILLTSRFGTTDQELKNLQEFVYKKAVSEEFYFPEELLLDWIRENERNQEIVIARNKEENLYKINLNYLHRLRSEALEDPTGHKLESLAFYLFSCVDGFEPILLRKTSAFHFDIIIRNLVNDHPLLQNLGEYIGVECKNLIKKVSVEELNHFIHKLRLHDIKCGIIFTSEGISGVGYKNEPRYGKAIQDKTFNRDGIVVFDLTSIDLDKISEGANLLSILLMKYEEIRFQ